MPVPKYPRIMVSPKRHSALAKAAKAAKMTLVDYAESVFKAADKK